MAVDQLDRRTLAVLAADVVGYSRLMEADEPGTIARLKAVRAEVVDPLIAEHHGRLVKLMGDGALVVFESVVDAVSCAVAIQRAVAGRDAGLPEAERIVFRIGVNLGDVALVDGDVYGDGVNVAARLEQMCDPGGVVVSGTAYDQLHGKLDLVLDFAGEQQLKNIARPVRAYRARLDGTARRRVRFGWRPARPRPVSVAATVALALLVMAGGWYALVARRPTPTSEVPSGTVAQGVQPSLVVLPFTNMSGDPSLDYFGDGITEDLTAQLARNPELRVIARSTAFAYKGKPVDMRRLGRELGARYALESSVRKAGDKVRIVAQLIDTATGTHVWADRYDEEGGDILSLQDQVAQRILASLGGFHGQIRQAAYRQVWAKPAATLEEYDYFLRVHDLIVSGRPEALDEARRLALEGLQRYPASGFLKIKLGWTYMQRADRGVSAGAERESDLARAYELGEEGLAHRDLTPLAELHGHWLMALAKLYHKHDYTAALAEREAALALAPSDAIVNADLARVAVFAGKPDLVVASLPGLLGEAPAKARSWLVGELGRAYCLGGQQALGIERLESLEADAFTYEALAYCYAEAGRRDEARAAVRGLLAQDPSVTLAAARKRNPFKDQAVLDRYLANLREAGVPEI